MKKATINKTNKLFDCMSSNVKFTEAINLDGEEFILEVRTDLTIQERSDIVDTVSLGCFSSQGYAPEYRDIIFAWKIIDIMTNLTAPVTKDKNIDLVKMQGWLNGINIIRYLSESSDRIEHLIYELKRLIDEKLEYQKQLVIHSNRADDLIDAVVNFLDKTTETINGINTLVGSLSVDSINEMAAKVAKDGNVDLNSLKGLLEFGMKEVADTGSETAPTLEVVK